MDDFYPLKFMCALSVLQRRDSGNAFEQLDKMTGGRKADREGDFGYVVIC